MGTDPSYTLGHSLCLWKEFAIGFQLITNDWSLMNR